MPEPSSNHPPSPPSSESYQAAENTSMSESDTEDFEVDDGTDEDTREAWAEEEQALLQSTQAEASPEDALLEKLQSSSKKHQR